MAVERLTDYTRRIWTALDADAPEGYDFQVNDVIYYMDSSQCGIVTYVYPEGSIDVEFLPDVGGGGSYEEVTLRVQLVNQAGNVGYARYTPDSSDLFYGLSTSYSAGAVHNLSPVVQNGRILLFINKNFSHLRQNDIEIPYTRNGYFYEFNYADIPFPEDMDTYPLVFTST